MSKKKVPDEQMDLIDVTPPNAKAIKALARKYKGIVKERMELSSKEVAAKERVKVLVKESGVVPDENGVITCDLGDMVIRVKPRDELVTVKMYDGEECGNDEE